MSINVVAFDRVVANLRLCISTESPMPMQVFDILLPGGLYVEKE